MHGVRILFASGLAVFLIGIAGPAAATEEYDPEYAGHPVRIAAYVLHPIGVLVDYLILRPAFWVGSQEPFATIFGRDD